MPAIFAAQTPVTNDTGAVTLGFQSAPNVLYDRTMVGATTYTIDTTGTTGGETMSITLRGAYAYSFASSVAINWAGGVAPTPECSAVAFDRIKFEVLQDGSLLGAVQALGARRSLSSNVLSSASFYSQASGIALSAYEPQAGASFTGSITGNTLTVSEVSSGSLAVGQLISIGAGFGLEIIEFGTGTGGAGTYTLNQSPSANIASSSMSTADVNATFNLIHSGASATANFGTYGNLNIEQYEGGFYYSDGAVIESNQDNIDFYQDFDVKSLTSSAYENVGILIGDDGTGQNFVAVAATGGTAQGSGAQIVTCNGGSTSLASYEPYSLSVGTIYTMIVQVRGSAGTYTVSVLMAPRGGSLTTVLSNISLPNIEIIGRHIGLYGLNYDAQQTDESGMHILNFQAVAIN